MFTFTKLKGNVGILFWWKMRVNLTHIHHLVFRLNQYKLYWLKWNKPVLCHDPCSIPNVPSEDIAVIANWLDAQSSLHPVINRQQHRLCEKRAMSFPGMKGEEYHVDIYVLFALSCCRIQRSESVTLNYVETSSLTQFNAAVWLISMRLGLELESVNGIRDDRSSHLRCLGQVGCH